MNYSFFKKAFTFFHLMLIGSLFSLNGLLSCSSKSSEQKEEQIRVNSIEYTQDTDSITNSIQGNVSFNQMNTSPNSVILTGLPEHRLVTVYKKKKSTNQSGSRYSKYYDYDGSEDENMEHFMPGIDILYGYHLLNIAHYNLKTEKLNFLFDQAALIKTLYYPSYVQDSIDKKPINRNYYLISVYDQDTNKDTLINRKDLRRFYHFDADCSLKTQLIPKDYSVMRSQYDPKNDVMYIFATHDANKNGIIEKDEPTHIFWINLQNPQKAKRLY